MGDFTTLTRATATSTGTWSFDGMICSYQIWTPDNPVAGSPVSGYVAPGSTGWPVAFFRMGGANMNPADLDLGTNTSYLTLANTFSCVIVAYDVTPGGFYLPGVVDPRAKFFPESFAEDAAAIIHFRNHAEDADYFGIGSITTEADRSLHGGLSSGGWRVLKTQLSRDGDFDYIATALQRGEHRFARRHSHVCNFVYVNQPQVLMSTFTMSKFVAAVQARADIDDTLSDYTVNGALTAGVSSAVVANDTVAAIKGQRITFGAATTQYALTADYAGGAGTMSFQPALAANVSDGAAVNFVETALEKYSSDTGRSENGSWCSGYYFSSASGYIWQDSIDVADPDAVFPWEIKRQGDVDNMISDDNPRVMDANWLFIGSSGNTLITSEQTGEKSFLAHAPAPWGTLADGTIDPSHNSLHGEFQSFLAAYALDACGNTENVAVYAGNTTSNPNSEVTGGANETNWNKGQNADFDSSVLTSWLQARDFA